MPQILVTDAGIAISTLLQPPIVRTGLLPHTGGPSAQKAPSTKEIPPVKLTNIPHIDSKVFQPYLSQVGSLYDAFQRAKEGVDEGRQHSTKSHSSRTDPIGGLLGQGFQRRPVTTPIIEAPSPIPGSPLGSPLGSPVVRRPANGGISRRGQFSVPPISTVPNVYFEQDFRLENPRTFDIVSERSEIIRSAPGVNGSIVAPGSSGRKALASNAILQEKLSWYMDTIEVHLISSISTASSSFFAALGSLRELHLEASDSVTKIQTLRKDLATLDKDMALGGLEVVAMRRRRENLQKLGDAVQQLSQIVEALARCDGQANNGDIEDALQGLTDVEKLIMGDGHSSSQETGPLHMRGKLIDLRGIKALEGAGRDIGYLRKKIGKTFESRFLEALLGDLRKHVDTVSSDSTFQRWDKASQRFRTNHSRTPSAFPAFLQLDDSLRSELKRNLEGLSQSESVMPAAIAYREAVLREIKSLIRRHLPSSGDDDNESTMSASTQGGRQRTQQEKSTILARNLRALDAEDTEDMLKKMYSNVGEALRRLGTQVKVILDITSTFGSLLPTIGLKSPLSPPIASMDDYMKGANPTSSLNHSPSQHEDIQQALDMTNLLGQAVDIAQTQITKILKVRSEQSTHLPLDKFLIYFHLNRLFADECEAVSGRGGAALKTVVNAHIKDFVLQFADAEKQHLLQTMDSDRWDAKDFTNSESHILDSVQEASTRDVEAWTKACTIWGARDSSMNGKAVNGSGPGLGKSQLAIIDEQRYILPESGITVLRGIEKFENLIAGIPSMTQEITLSLLDYLGLFNSRSRQLILGAGATKSAGLKNITTKHLALASQALSFVTALTPYVREFIRRHSSGSGGLMTEFDKMKRGYQEHQEGINDKLIEIMSGRATTHVNSMKKIDWDAISNPKVVNGYMETLVKETTTLHKVLSKHLPDINVQMIMYPVFSSYKEQWGNAFQDVKVKTQTGKSR